MQKRWAGAAHGSYLAHLGGADKPAGSQICPIEYPR